MSRLYKQYSYLKKKDEAKAYLFKVGIFYIFLDQDARRIAPLLNLKCTKLTDTIEKCGFPVNSFTKYEQLLKENNILFGVIEDEPCLATDDSIKIQKIKHKLEQVQLEKITPIDAFDILKEMKGILDNG